MGFIYTPEGAFYVHRSLINNEVLAVFALKKETPPPKQLPSITALGITPEFIERWRYKLAAKEGPADIAMQQKTEELARIGGNRLLAIGKARASGLGGVNLQVQAERAAARAATLAAKKAAGRAWVHGGGQSSASAVSQDATSAPQDAAAAPLAGFAVPQAGFAVRQADGHAQETFST